MAAQDKQLSIQKINNMKGIFNLICLAAWVIGGFGGFGYCIFHKQPFIAVCVAALAAMAFPFVKKCWKVLNGGL